MFMSKNRAGILPGWGHALRCAPAAIGLALAGCQAPAAQPLPAGMMQAALSKPAGLRDALGIAVGHVQSVPQTDFHLVAFHGEHLDAQGRTVPGAGSAWTFTFSRYAAPAPANDLMVVDVTVPGAGYASLQTRASTDAALSPIESADGLLAAGGIDSAGLLAPLVALGVPTNAGTMDLAQGVVTVKAADRSVTYDVASKTFSPVK